MSLTGSFFELRQHRFVDVVIDTLRVTVISDEEKIVHSGVLLTLPEG